MKYVNNGTVFENHSKSLIEISRKKISQGFVEHCFALKFFISILLLSIEAIFQSLLFPPLKNAEFEKSWIAWPPSRMPCFTKLEH